MSFVRRYTSMPSPEVISQIEGIVIVDLPAPASLSGVSTGVVGLVGEFADMKYAVSVDGNGNVTTKCQPQAITTSQDMVNMFGGFDPTLGEFGGDDGNGYVAATNKQWSGLVIAPVNLASPKAVRMWRELPTNKSNTNPYPIVPMAAGFVAAGTEFKAGANRVKVATSVTFTGDGPIAFGVLGEQISGPGPLFTFQTTDSFNFANAGVKVGDALVLGALGELLGDPGTYRIVSVAPNGLSIQVQRLDGTPGDAWGGDSALAWRIHPASTFDTGANNQLSENDGYTLPARPLDATISAATSILPTIQAVAGSATEWNALSGLAMRTMPSEQLVFNTNTQSANKATTSALVALYQIALDSLLTDAAPMSDVSIVFSARTSSELRSALKTHVQIASSQGRGRVAVVAPPITMVSEQTAIGNSSPGVGATRDERVVYCWPGFQTYMDVAQNTPIKRATGNNSTNGYFDVRSDSYMASILSNLASERNPGQAAEPVPTCLSSVKGFQSGALPDFTISNYTLFKQYGIAAPRNDRSSGWQFQSGITSSLTSGQRNINRRRMADEVQDSLAAIYEKFSKLPLTIALKDQIDTETTAYLNGLLSPNNPAAQRIEGFLVDSKSGNTPQLNAQGIYVVIVKVRMLGTADDIVIQSEVGPTVNVTAA